MTYIYRLVRYSHKRSKRKPAYTQKSIKNLKICQWKERKARCVNFIKCVLVCLCVCVWSKVGVKSVKKVGRERKCCTWKGLTFYHIVQGVINRLFCLFCSFSPHFRHHIASRKQSKSARMLSEGRHQCNGSVQNDVKFISHFTAWHKRPTTNNWLEKTLICIC